MARTTSRRALAAALALLFLPWSVQMYESGFVTLLFAWGSTTPAVGSVTTLPDFLLRFTAGLPGWMYAWPISTALYAMALLSGALGVRSGREDVRLTGGLLALAGVGVLWVSWGFSFQPGRIALPTGTAALWGVAWWFYAPLVRARVRSE
jgi:uncharacterized protein (TIGR04206 family)